MANFFLCFSPPNSITHPVLSGLLPEEELHVPWSFILDRNHHRMTHENFDRQLLLYVNGTYK